MKEKIFQLLKQEYSHLGLGDPFLLARAEMLDSLGFVTAENVNDVVAKQKASLEAQQRANDARVTEAIKKHDEDLKKKAEEEAKKAKAEAEKKAAEEAAKKAAEEAAKKAQEQGGLTPGLKEYLENLEKSRKAELEEQLKAQKATYEKTIKELTSSVNNLRESSERAAAEKAKAERQAKITNKAKELGIPQSRIDEGFLIADDADDSTIAAYLGTVKKNIDVTRLPQANHFQLGDGKPSTEEVKDIVDGLLG